MDSFSYSPELLNQSENNSTDSIFVLQNSKSNNSQQQLFSNKTIQNFQALEEDRSIWHKKIKQLSAKFNYQKSDNNPRINYTSSWKSSSKKIIKNTIRLLFKGFIIFLIPVYCLFYAFFKTNLWVII